MPQAIAFFPWVTIREPITVGTIRLFPYTRGELLDWLEHASQADVETVLGAYAEHPRVPIEAATLLEVGDWKTGQPVDTHLTALFDACQAIGFAALAARRLFARNFAYCNFHSYTLIVQSYRPGEAESFAFTTRRRDGHTHQMWGSDEFAFHRPHHVPSNADCAVDRDFLRILLERQQCDSRLREAVVEFNSANTDSADVPEHTELVMTKSAFEVLLAVGPNANEFEAALVGLFGKLLDHRAADGPLRNRWQEARPKSGRPLTAWAMEFCAIRGVAAHGASQKAEKFVRSRAAHLAFS